MLGCKQVGVAGIPPEYTYVEPSSTSSPSGHLQMLEDLVSYSGSYVPFHSNGTECVQRTQDEHTAKLYCSMNTGVNLIP